MYKILSKQNFSVALTLILTILLSQSNIMNLLFDTILGRTILVLILLCISYTNQILGVVSTLFAVMIFACSYNSTENFTPEIAPEAPTSDIAPTPEIAASPTPVSDDSAVDNDDKDARDSNKYNVSEGFDILGTERNIQGGKQSNKIMVNEDMRKSDNVDPYDGWNNQAQFTSI